MADVTPTPAPGRGFVGYPGSVWKAVPRASLLMLVALILVCVIAPLATTLLTSVWTSSLGTPGTFTLGNFAYALTDRSTLLPLENTVVLVAGASFLTMFLAAALAWIVTSTDVPARWVLRLLPLMPLFLPGLLKNTAWIELFSPRTGSVNLVLMHVLGLHSPPFNIYSMLGMITVIGVDLVPIPYLILLGPFASVDHSLSEVSRTLGAGAVRTLRRVVVPVLAPAFLSAFALSMIIVASAFEVPILIGVPGNVPTYMSSIYRSIATSVEPNYNLASAQSTIYLLLTGACLAWYWRSTRVERRFATVGGRGYSVGLMRLGWWKYVLAAFVMTYFVLGFVQLFVVTALVSLVPFYTVTAGNPFATLTLENYRAVFSSADTLVSLINSLVLSSVVSLLALGAALLLSYLSLKTRLWGRRVAELIGTLPIGIPALVFSVALLMTVLSTPTLALLYPTFVPLLIAETIIFLPYTVRTMSSALVQLHDDLLEASAMSGASLAKTARRILIPLLQTALLGAFAIVFALSFRELGGVALLVTPNTSLFPTLIFGVWQKADLVGTAALNIVSVLVPAVILMVVYVILQRRRGFTLDLI